MQGLGAINNQFPLTNVGDQIIIQGEINEQERQRSSAHTVID